VNAILGPHVVGLSRVVREHSGVTRPQDTIWTQVERLVADLRRRGADVSLTEVLDAARAIEYVDLSRRVELRSMLGATLVKHAHHQAMFAELFDRHFPVRLAPPLVRPGRGVPADGDAAGRAGLDGERAELDRAAVERAMLDPDADRRLLVEQIVDRFAGLDEGERTERYHLYRVLRAIDLAAILSAAIARARRDGEPVDRAALDARVASLRAMIADEIRARLDDAAQRSIEPGRTADPFDVELARASASELDDVRAAIRPLARRLAAQLRHRRQSRGSGRVDIRRTIHRSLANGGVPLDVVDRRPRAHRPELFVLCDVSGSVADFAGFTLTLISALADELRATRTFAFVDAIDEISALLGSTSRAIEPWQLLQSGRVIGDDGHSDYGRVFEAFWERYGRHGLSPRSTVVVVGDARGNHRPSRPDVVAQIAARARRVYWLNPEPRAEWDTTDSVQAVYTPYCSAVYEVRTLAQLSAAVLDML
jgi:uncharacterized protein